MVLGATACSSNSYVPYEDNKKNVESGTATEKKEKETEKEEKFKEVDGKVEVYLPVHYTYSAEQQYQDEEKIGPNEGSLEYDENGLLLTEKFHGEEDIDGFNEWDYENSYNYNSEYQLTGGTDQEEDARSVNGGEDQYYYNYDEDGRLLSVECVDEEFDICYEMESETGTLTRYNSNRCNSNDEGYWDYEVYWDYTYEYDTDGNITRYDEEYNRVSDGYYEYSGCYTYEYNEDGNVIKKVHTDYLGNEKEEFVEYDKDGYITSCDGIKLGEGIKIKYNKQHKPVTLEYRGERKSSFSYEYKNDLISKIIIYNDGEEKEQMVLEYDEHDK